MTTPGAPALQRALRAMAAAGDRAAVVETTSHGLALARVDGIAYDAAIFTNLTHEHLELHGSFEAYRAAKVSLFERLGIAGRKVGAAGDLAPWPAVGIVNVDDPNAAFFAEGTRRAGARLITYGTERRAEVRATAVDEDARRLRVGVEAPGWRGTLAYTFDDQIYTRYTERLSAGSLTRSFDRAGNRIPGVPAHQLLARLGYDVPSGPRHQSSRSSSD